jgi:hypothetical protein
MKIIYFSLYPITSHNQCAKFGFLTQFDTNLEICLNMNPATNPIDKLPPIPDDAFYVLRPRDLGIDRQGPCAAVYLFLASKIQWRCGNPC